MARVIEFHIPEAFNPKARWHSPEDYGKLLHFVARRPGLSDAGAAKTAKAMADVPLLRKMPIL
jgi:hypothetical protein